MAEKDLLNITEYKFPADWRGELLRHIRTLIHKADHDVVEAVKYKTASNPNGVLVWYHDGMLLTGEIYKKHLRLSLAKGNILKEHDPAGLINSYRAILIHEGDVIDEKAFHNLIRAAVDLNKKK